MLWYLLKIKQRHTFSIESEYFGADSKLFQVDAKSETQIGCKKKTKQKRQKRFSPKIEMIRVVSVTFGLFTLGIFLSSTFLLLPN